MNTYEKRGEGGRVIVNRNPRKDFFLERPSGAEGLSVCLFPYLLLRYLVSASDGRELPL